MRKVIVALALLMTLAPVAEAGLYRHLAKPLAKGSYHASKALAKGAAHAAKKALY